MNFCNATEGALKREGLIWLLGNGWLLLGSIRVTVFLLDWQAADSNAKKNDVHHRTGMQPVSRGNAAGLHAEQLIIGSQIPPSQVWISQSQ